jgi:hypothetical protein
MARLLTHHANPVLRPIRTFNVADLLLQASRAIVVGGIAIVIALAIVNTIVGTPEPEVTYTQYGS